MLTWWHDIFKLFQLIPKTIVCLYYKNEIKHVKLLQHDHLNSCLDSKDLETINYIPVTITIFFKECCSLSLCYQLILVVHAKCRSVITLWPLTCPLEPSHYLTSTPLPCPPQFSLPWTQKTSFSAIFFFFFYIFSPSIFLYFLISYFFPEKEEEKVGLKHILLTRHWAL